MFFADLYALSLLFPTINKAFSLSNFNAVKIDKNSFVFGVSNFNPSRTRIPSSFAFKERAERRATLFNLMLRSKRQFLGRGPNARPPPLKIGLLIEPARAVPVPFCFLIFLVLPVMSALSLDLCVP